MRCNFSEELQKNKKLKQKGIHHDNAFKVKTI